MEDQLGSAGRYQAMSYNEIFDEDSRPVPAFLREEAVPDLGTEPVPARNYICPDHYRKEVERLWPNVWVVACREEDIPNIGDYIIHELAGKSYLIVRTADNNIKALLNVCLHRGRKLATESGCAHRFTCTFHGISWNRDGSLASNPLASDLPQWEGKDMGLPEARVGTWGGFVFVTLTDEAPPLEQVLHPLPEHFAGYHFDDMYTAIHFAKKFPSNWKVTAEAFMESHHALATHPQLSPFIQDMNSKYDVLSPYISRHMSATCIPGAFIDASKLTENDIFRAMLGNGGRNEGLGELPPLPDGETARIFAAQLQRAALAAATGYDYSENSDAEMLDALLYNVFPNLSVWAGFSLNLVYLWHPVDVDNSVMEVRVLKRVPKGQPRPAPAKLQWIEAETPCASIAELGPLGGVFDQDMANLPHVQSGLKAAGPDFPVHFTKYTELRIRQMHQLIENYLKD